MQKKRVGSLLTILHDKHPHFTRDDLYSRIMCGEVFVDGEVVRNPKMSVSAHSDFSFAAERYVSRGGEKLEGALADHRLDVRNRVVLDAGASTGGFTHCLLRAGARHVHSVDVGYNQLSYNLRTDSRVTAHERCNIMSVTVLDPTPGMAVADLSFRSIRGAALHILNLVAGNMLLALIKPQFEWIHPPDSFRGVVESPDDIRQILLALADGLAQDSIEILSASESRIRGRQGNREFFFLLQKGRSNLAETQRMALAAINYQNTARIN